MARSARRNVRDQASVASQLVQWLKTPSRDGNTHLATSPFEFTQLQVALRSRPRLYLIPCRGAMGRNDVSFADGDSTA